MLIINIVKIQTYSKRITLRLSDMIKHILYLFAVYNSSSITTVYVVTFTFSLTHALTTGPRSESKHCYKYGFAGIRNLGTHKQNWYPAVTLPTKIFIKSLTLKTYLVNA